MVYYGLQYCLKQELYLRIFLYNGNVPKDNNRSEQAICPFTIGRKNRSNMHSANEALASTVIYSIVETANANNLKVYDYPEYFFTELPKHADDNRRNFIKDLLPYAEAGSFFM
ncbi:IS66 C-terminal element [Lachnospiraceae bacterium XBB2008]|nr:IS66 C-terminal element [Lachnospiraceae bacterium XBB2008]